MKADKLHTLLDVLLTPSFFRDYRRGMLPGIYTRLKRPWLAERQFDTILDIGANAGLFSLTAAAVFPRARIFAFEPIPECFQATQRVLARIGRGTAIQTALGTAVGHLEMNLSDHSPSSSLLEMSDAHRQAFPFTAGHRKISIPVAPLDQVASTLDIGNKVFVKIDVQGYEREVIAGGKATLSAADVILVELSFVELYKGQPLFADVQEQLRELGFRFAGTFAQMSHPESGKTIDADCFFVKEP